MLPFEDRYTRQRQLIEVGLEGQSRLQRSPLRWRSAMRCPTTRES